MSSSSTPAPEPAPQDAAPAEPDGGWFGSASEAHRPVDPPKRAWRAYFEATQMLTEVLERRLKQDCGMSLADYNLLLLLYESPEGRLRLGELVLGINRAGGTSERHDGCDGSSEQGRNRRHKSLLTVG